MPYITGVSAPASTQAGYFTDNNGQPRLWVASETWGLPVNAGAWSGSGGGTYEQDYDNFFSARAAQGFTVCMTDATWCPTGNGAHSGNTWDGLTPLTGGVTNPTGATLNSTFWARIDYMFSSAASSGITIGLVIANTGDDVESGYWQDTWTATQWTNYATLVGTRYASTPNLVWLVGNDSFSPSSDTIFNAVLAGLADAGATQLIAPWYNAECTARYLTDTDASEDWGVSNAAFNFCYTYNAGYFVLEYAYNEVTRNGAANLLPVIWGDGYFYTGGGASYYSPTDRAVRQEWWWCLATGARGILGESENVYPWSSGSCVTAVTGNVFFGSIIQNAVAAFTSWTGWWKLLPDLTSALVTAGRGTRVSGYASGGSGGQYEESDANSYVAASKTPDGTLAVMYLPNHTTITVNTALLASGWTASWIDPVSGTSSSAGAGPTFNSTAKGTNSQGDPDWALVFQAPAGPAPSGTGPALYGFRS